jgi:hypothetical protein
MGLLYEKVAGDNPWIWVAHKAQNHKNHHSESQLLLTTFSFALGSYHLFLKQQVAPLLHSKPHSKALHSTASTASTPSTPSTASTASTVRQSAVLCC